uniref:Uncharacterized protein n=1 Tax=Glossina pallidipes TaxID=7398 RepID=A0A1A9Z7A8_GLOPL
MGVAIDQVELFSQLIMLYFEFLSTIGVIADGSFTTGINKPGAYFCHDVCNNRTPPPSPPSPPTTEEQQSTTRTDGRNEVWAELEETGRISLQSNIYARIFENSEILNKTSLSTFGGWTKS